jgi:hypothetical protein
VYFHPRKEKPMSSTLPPKPTGDPGAGIGGGGSAVPGGLGGGGSGGTGGEPDGLPWEHRAQLGLVSAIVDTVKGVLMEPATTFRAMRKSGGVGEPLVYAVLLGWVGGIFGLVWQALISAIGPLAGAGEGLEEYAEGVIGIVVIAVLLPAFIALGQFIGAAIVHLFALMFGAGDKGFEVTFRVMAYSSGSTAVLNVVPIVGGLAAWVWSLIATIIGLTEAQETSGGKAAAAVLVPLLLLCCCGIAVVIALVFAAGAADAF